MKPGGLTHDPTIFELTVDYTDPVTQQNYKKKKNVSVPVGPPPLVLNKPFSAEWDEKKLWLSWEAGDNTDRVEITSEPRTLCTDRKTSATASLSNQRPTNPCQPIFSLTLSNEGGSLSSTLI